VGFEVWSVFFAGMECMEKKAILSRKRYSRGGRLVLRICARSYRGLAHCFQFPVLATFQTRCSAFCCLVSNLLSISTHIRCFGLPSRPRRSAPSTTSARLIRRRRPCNEGTMRSLRHR
ncbi:unnamed protein product, partial [Phaeothamnion confervicola]